MTTQDSIKSQEELKKTKKKKKTITQSVATAAGNVVSKKGYVSAIDLFIGLGWLTPGQVVDWRKGKIPYLERVVMANLNKLTRTMKEFKAWAIHSKLKPSLTAYKHKGSHLRFSKSGQKNIEIAYSTHYVLPQPKEEKINPE